MPQLEDRTCAPVWKLWSEGSDLMIAICYFCKRRVETSKDALEDAGWTDLERNWSEPDDSYLIGICPMPLCREKFDKNFGIGLRMAIDTGGLR